MIPSQHAAVLHSLKAEEQVFIGRKLTGPPHWKQDPYHPWESDMVLYDAARQQDLYLTQNRFEGRGKVLQQLGSSLGPSVPQNRQRSGVAYKEIEGSSSAVETGVVWRRDDVSAVLQVFLKIVKETASRE